MINYTVHTDVPVVQRWTVEGCERDRRMAVCIRTGACRHTEQVQRHVGRTAQVRRHAHQSVQQSQTSVHGRL